MENEIKKPEVVELEERGATMVEYALVIALIAVICIAAVTFLGTTASQRFSSVGSSIAGATG